MLESAEELDSEEEAQRAVDKAKQDKLDAKRQFRKRMKMRALNISKKVVCFQDEEEEFDDDNLPTCKQVCCWRLIRARKRTQEFHTSMDGLVAFEKSKY